MKSSSTIGTVVLSLLVMFIIVKILTFYGFDISSYGTYIAFYLFLLVTMLVLPQTISFS